MNRFVPLSLIGVGLAASVAHAQIEINPNLSVTGFIDMSATYADFDGGDSSSFNLDQAEIDFLINFEPISAQFDLNYLGDNDDGEFDLEQGFLTYDFGNGASMNFGKFLSYHGWEAAEPTGLWQYSYGYELVGSIPGYHNGVTYDYSGDWGSFGVALLDSVYNADGSLDDSEFGFETKVTLTPVEGLTLYFGYAHDSYDGGFTGALDSIQLLNFWTSYEYDSWTFAAEVNNYTESFSGAGDFDAFQWLLMANLAIDDTNSVTFRVSGEDTDDGDLMKYTAAYLKNITENLALVFEASHSDFDSDFESTNFAIEALFTY